MTERRGFDCVVIGAGIAGVCAALNLQRQGAKVAIVDAERPGSGASSGNAGIIANTNLRPVFAGLTPVTLLQMLRSPTSPLNVRWSRILGLTPWFLRMLRHAGPAEVERITRALASLCHPGAELYDPIVEEAGAKALVQARGSLALVRAEAAMDAHWDKGLAFLRQLNVPMEKVDRHRIADLAPSVNPAYTHGVFSPAYRHTLDPQLFVQSLFDLFLARGGTAIEAKAGAVTATNGRVAGVSTPRGPIEGDVVVIAAGSHSASFARAAGEPVPHQAVGGYHAMLRNPGVALETPLLPLDFRVAITPMGDSIRVAGTYEFGGEGLPFDHSRIDGMLAHIGAVLPGIRVEPMTVWRGFRSYLPDGLPIISQSSVLNGLFYSFGFSSSGMINGSAAGKAVADLVQGATPSIDPETFSIRRFLPRGGGRPASSPATLDVYESNTPTR
ncbi:NAD(P)/FAD-dependent oxidoreductase [Alsobacter sp. SYSU BS001988]